MQSWIRFAGMAAAAALFAPPLPAQQVRYDGSSVVRMHAASEDEAALALSLTDDVWSEAAGAGDFDMRVRPEQRAALQSSGLRFDVLIGDVQQLIDQEQSGGIAGGDPFASYMTL